ALLAIDSQKAFLPGMSSDKETAMEYINDNKAFMVKDAIISPNSDYTKNVEQMFDAVSYEVVQAEKP
ncbi:MAG: hypothetical protein WCI71_20195, partial [Bacteroidota bacterium]